MKRMDGQAWKYPWSCGRKEMEGKIELLCSVVVQRCFDLQLFNTAWHFSLFPLFVGISVTGHE